MSEIKQINTVDKTKSILRSIKRFWYRHQKYTPFYAMAFGKFRVLYKDNQKSIPMDYKTATNYAEIFGGKVIDNF